MGHAETGDKKRSLSSPSLFRRLSITSQSSTKTTRSTLAVRARWASLTSPKTRPSSHPCVSPSRTSTVEEEGDDDAEQQGPGFLPLIRIASPLDPFADLPQTAQPSRHKHKRSTSWSEVVAIFAGRTSDGDHPLVTHSEPAKRKPKFTLESPSDLDLSRQPSLRAMLSSALSPPGSTPISPVASSSSLASASGMTTSTVRPHLVRRDASSNPSRRYTFAMAMTDEHISDETLVQELERIRAVNALTGSSAGNLEEFWDLSQSHSPFDSTSEGSSSQGFFEGASCESPIEQLDADPCAGIAVTKPSPQHERRMPCRSSLPAFPVHHRLSTASGSSQSGPSTSDPNSARTSMLESDASWHTARRALLTCRECVRTERHYLYGMRTLVSQDTASPPPPLMVQYAENLVNMSERLLARMEENPNVWGVTTAFLGEENVLEEAFVNWCGKVGAWFEGKSVDEDVKGKGKQPRDNSQEKEKTILRKNSKGKLNEGSTTVRRSLSSWKKGQPVPDLPTSPGDSSSSSSSTSSSSSSTSTSSATSPATSVASSAPPSKPAIPLSSGAGPTVSFYPGSLLNRKKDKEVAKMTSGSQSVGVARQDSSSSSGSGNGAVRTMRKSAVRDLAILPTQRVMRYVLLFKDLLAHTPSTSPARALVERAVDAAVRIADKCDQAQNHAAFSQIPPPLPPKDSILPRTWTRHMNYSMTRDSLPFGSSRKTASEHGHASSMTDIAAIGSVSVPPTRPPSAHGEKSSPKVLTKPKRSNSTGAMGAALPAFTAINSSDVTNPDHTTECNRSSNKLKKRAGANAPPPSAFPLKTQAASAWS